MKIPRLLPVCLLTFVCTNAWGQSAPGMAPGSTRQGLPPRASQEASGLARFDLDFPGGTPKQLVDAIQRAMGRPLNAIIPDEHAGVKLPALKMQHVDVSQLFAALIDASQKTEAVSTGNYYGGGAYGGYQSFQTVQTTYGFKPGSGGNVTDDTIWYFYVTKPALPPLSAPSTAKVCRFYALASYPQSVDDITTAIETAWRMMGETNPPSISYHKDTKLLIAVGDASRLETIDSVLKALQPPPSAPAPPHPVPGMGAAPVAPAAAAPPQAAPSAPMPKPVKPKAGD